MPQMTESMAREILSVAAKTGAWEEAGESPVSVSADRAFTDAQDLVKIAREVYDKRSAPSDPLPEAVIEILFAAQVEPENGKFADVYQAKGVEPPASNGNAPAEPAQDGPAVSGDIDIESIYQGYDDQKAKDIVEAIKAAALSGDFSPEEWAQVKAYESTHEERKSILSLEPEFKSKPQPPSSLIGSQTGAGFVQQSTGDYAHASTLESAYNDGGLGSDRVRQEGLPIPPAPSGDEPVLPVDITSVSDQDLSRLMMRFHSLEARTLWVLSQEEGRQEACKSLRHDSHRAAFAREFERLKGGIDTSKITHVDSARSEANSLADADSSVVAWRNREIRHGIEARGLRALAEGYGNAAARLSRELTRRTDLRQTPTG